MYQSSHVYQDCTNSVPTMYQSAGPIMLIILFLVSHSNFLFVPCGRLSWLPVSFLLHVKYPLSYRIVIVKNSPKSQKTVKTAKMTIGVPIVTMVSCLPRLYQQCTNSVTIVKNSEKQSKDSQNSKNEGLRLRG